MNKFEFLNARTADYNHNNVRPERYTNTGNKYAINRRNDETFKHNNGQYSARPVSRYW